MDTFKLKILAITAMLIDHIGIIFFSGTNHYWIYLACRSIGRLAFPIFAFLITEGFLHTKDIKKYLKRLFVFAVISEIPFDLAFYKYNFKMDVLKDIGSISKDITYSNAVLNRLNQHQNVFFTLFLGLALLVLFDMVEKKFNKNTFMDLLIANSLDAALTVAFCALAILFHTDYSIAGILIITAFYLFKNSKILMAFSLFLIAGSLLCNFAGYSQNKDLLSIISILAVFAMIPIAFYNGKKGKNVKYFFYAFYPVHLLCLFMFGVLLQVC
jgi:heme O synthase-like polyprenyltransferase